MKIASIWSFSDPYSPSFGLNTERYSVSQSECGKIRTRKTPNTDTFHPVWPEKIWDQIPSIQGLAYHFTGFYMIGILYLNKDESFRAIIIIPPLYTWEYKEGFIEKCSKFLLSQLLSSQNSLENFRDRVFFSEVDWIVFWNVLKKNFITNIFPELSEISQQNGYSAKYLWMPCPQTCTGYLTAWKVSKCRVVCGPYSVRIQENTDQK